MTRTRPTLLLLCGVVGALLGWFFELGLVASGRPAAIPPVTLGAALALIGVVMVLLAAPIHRVVRKLPGARVDPFYATRVVLLAKASSIAGSLVSGVAAAILVFLLTRAVLPAVGSVTVAVVTTVGALVLLAGGLLAEKMCTLPPDDDGTKEPTT